MRTKASTKTETRSKKFLFEKRRPAPKNCGRPRGGVAPPFQQPKPTRKKRRGLSFSTKKRKRAKKKKESACQRKLERRQNFVERLFALNKF